MKYVLAIDSFKGSMTSAEAEEAVANAIRQAQPGSQVTSIPVSDGGEGMLDAFTGAMGGRKETAEVHDPMMRRITAEYGVTDDGTAIIETAKANGLVLVEEKERNPMRATSYGVGELIAHAIKQGCRNFIIGLGGSATSDAGIGMLKALTEKLAPKGGHIDDVLAGIAGGCMFTLACDVDNPLYGTNGAAAVFGRQKGATEEMISLLDGRAERFARMSARHFGYDCSGNKGAGAAGGLGYAFMQYLKAGMRSGAELMLDVASFDDKINGADIVITGEGCADRQTLMGKMPYKVLERASRKDVPVWLLAGKLADKELLEKAGFNRIECITPHGTSLADAMRTGTAQANIAATTARML